MELSGPWVLKGLLVVSHLLVAWAGYVIGRGRGHAQAIQTRREVDIDILQGWQRRSSEAMGGELNGQC